MTLHSTRSALGAGSAEHLACDVVTEVEPRPGGQVSAIFVFAAAIRLARVRAYWSRKPPSAIQDHSLWMRAPEVTKFALCEELGIGLVAWGPLGQGFLTGAITKDRRGRCGRRGWSRPPRSWRGSAPAARGDRRPIRRHAATGRGRSRREQVRFLGVRDLDRLEEAGFRARPIRWPRERDLAFEAVQLADGVAEALGRLQDLPRESLMSGSA
jgi:hypothetical protein